ncbi:hypothetical protein G4D61_01160 [Bacillus ginsengihumi]|uniref:EVE domain-containing protein n=1 Tax=Heyndrickxia ginsengihumi TaxID=363870 RepID=A0A6M0P5K9_9BACI|nr:hypothetical protein [Heyndrickxia ginsengihumi]NEY18578.1 hypothetical protein [Heyndrickxia ginsengihumi]
MSHKLMFVARPSNWEFIKDKFDFWPLKLKDARLIDRYANIDDEVLVYLSQKSAITGLLKIREKPKRLDSPLSFTNNEYEYYLPITYSKILTEDLSIPLRPLISELELTKMRQDNWGAVLQKAVVKIKEKDFELLYSKIIS